MNIEPWPPDTLRPVRLVHTSDLHLGDDIGAAAKRRGLLAALAAAREVNAEAVLIAGDIFDSARVEDEEIVFFLEAVASARVPVVALPGNHDCLEGGSVYHRPVFRTLPPNLRLLTDPAGEGVVLEEMDLVVWGRPTEHHIPEFRPLERVPLLAPSRAGRRPWYVAMAHGQLMEGLDQYTRSSPILPDDIASAVCDYVALGHWDATTEVSQGVVPAWYSGTPLQEWRGGRGGNVLVVDFVPGVGAMVRPAKAAKLD